VQIICLEQTQEKIKNNHSFGSLFKFCESFIWDKNTKVVMFFRKQIFASHTFGKNFKYIYFLGFLLCFLLGKDFVKVFYWICVSHSFICDKKNTKFAFFLCALCIFRKIICEGFSKCKPIHLGCKNNAFLCFFLLLKFLLRFAIHLGWKYFQLVFIIENFANVFSNYRETFICNNKTNHHHHHH